VTTEGIPRDNGGLRAAVVLPMFRGKRMCCHTRKDPTNGSHRGPIGTTPLLQ